MFQRSQWSARASTKSTIADAICTTPTTSAVRFWGESLRKCSSEFTRSPRNVANGFRDSRSVKLKILGSTEGLAVPQYFRIICRKLLILIGLLLVPRRGLEPPRIAPLVPETSASTNSATWAGAQSGAPGSVRRANLPMTPEGVNHAGCEIGPSVR